MWTRCNRPREAASVRNILVGFPGERVEISPPGNTAAIFWCSQIFLEENEYFPPYNSLIQSIAKKRIKFIGTFSGWSGLSNDNFVGSVRPLLRLKKIRQLKQPLFDFGSVVIWLEHTRYAVVNTFADEHRNSNLSVKCRLFAVCVHKENACWISRPPKPLKIKQMYPKIQPSQFTCLMLFKLIRSKSISNPKVDLSLLPEYTSERTAVTASNADPTK